MSTPPKSPRTMVRDTVMSVLNSRTDKSIARVSAFKVSKKFLNAQETGGGNTYCVLITDEDPEKHTHGAYAYAMTLKIVIYANHSEDPHTIVDGMIEDLIEAMGVVRNHADLDEIVFNIRPDVITSDDRTTEAGPWGQAVCTWKMDHTRH